jgi:hypothetical protein
MHSLYLIPNCIMQCVGSRWRTVLLQFYVLLLYNKWTICRGTQKSSFVDVEARTWMALITCFKFRTSARPHIILYSENDIVRDTTYCDSLRFVDIFCFLCMSGRFCLSSFRPESTRWISVIFVIGLTKHLRLNFILVYIGAVCTWSSNCEIFSVVVIVVVVVVVVVVVGTYHKTWMCNWNILMWLICTKI